MLTPSQTIKEKQRRWEEAIIRGAPNRSIPVLAGLIKPGFLSNPFSPVTHISCLVGHKTRLGSGLRVLDRSGYVPRPSRRAAGSDSSELMSSCLPSRSRCSILMF